MNREELFRYYIGDENLRTRLILISRMITVFKYVRAIEGDMEGCFQLDRLAKDLILNMYYPEELAEEYSLMKMQEIFRLPKTNLKDYYPYLSHNQLMLAQQRILQEWEYLMDFL